MMTAQGTAIPTPYADDVEILADLGYFPVPIHAGRKNPILKDWPLLSREQAVRLADVHPHASIGIHCRNVRAVDVDFMDPTITGLIEQWLIKNAVKDGDALIRVGQAPKFAILFGATGKHRKRNSASWVDPNDPSQKAQKVETLGEGQQLVVGGIHPTTGKPYTWKNGGPVSTQTSVIELPVITDEQLDALDQYVFDTVSSRRPHWVLHARASGSKGTHSSDGESPFPVAGLTPELAAEALSCIPQDGPANYDYWVDVGMALHQQGGGDVDWFELWDEWSSRHAKYEGHVGKYGTWTKWQSFDAERPGGITMRSVLMDAEAQGWTRPQSVEGARLEQEAFPDMNTEEVQETEEPEEEKPVFSDDFRQVDINDLAMADIPPAQFIVEPYLPERVATILGAHGGAGKSRLALQLAVHVAMGIPFANHNVKRAKVLVYSAEDDVYTLRRRIQAICRHLEVDPAELSKWLMVLDVTDIDPALYRETSERGVKHGKYTEAFTSLYRRAHAFQARMVIIDNSSDVYDANENERVRVRAFVRILGTLARKLEGAVLLVMHVDKATAKTGGGEGYSGSTAWHNSARSRMFLRREEDTYLLEHQKANFSAPAAPLQMVFEPIGSEAVMVPVEQAEWIHDERRKSEAEEDAAVLAAIVDASKRENIPTAMTGAANTLLTLSRLGVLPEGMCKGEGKRRFWATLARLEKTGRILREAYKNDHRHDRTRWISAPAPAEKG